VTRWVDVRTVFDGEPCVECGAPLTVFPAIEAGHIFKLGTFYAEPLGVKVLDKDGKMVPVVMGSYGIGVERNMAAAVEANHDEKGIVWPDSVAPFHVGLINLRAGDAACDAACADLYARLGAAGVDCLYDDRDERAGVKFADMELIGLPWQLVVGPRGVKAGTVELKSRRTGESAELSVDGALARLTGG